MLAVNHHKSIGQRENKRNFPGKILSWCPTKFLNQFGSNFFLKDKEVEDVSFIFLKVKKKYDLCDVDFHF